MPNRRKGGGSGDSRGRDYTQLPQKPIRLKPSIAKEKPSRVTRLDQSPAELLAGEDEDRDKDEPD